MTWPQRFCPDCDALCVVALAPVGYALLWLEPHETGTWNLYRFDGVLPYGERLTDAEILGVLAQVPDALFYRDHACDRRVAA